jgi:hypothetical protein
MRNTQKIIRNLSAGALALGTLAALGIAVPAASAPSYDGLWSVVIITEKGTCDRAYRYPIRISKGTMLNAGDSPVTIKGNVGNNGSVTVRVSYGDKSATGSGRLSSSIGVGSWSGGECSGTWEAERRGA